MFRLPAYDPVGIAMLGFGILAVAAWQRLRIRRLAGHSNENEKY